MFKDKRPGKWALLGLLLLAALIGLVLFFGLRAQAAAGEKFLPIKEVTSPGGIKVWLVEDHSLPIIAMRFIFLDSGSALDPADKQGLARLLSNTLDEGAGTLDSQAFQKELTDRSIELSFGAGRDGFTGEIKTLSRHKYKAFELAALALTAPRFDAEAVDRMRDANLSRIRSSLSEPDWMAARLINDRAFEGHPYAKNNGGTLSSLARITPADLKKFKEDNLTRDRLMIGVSGDIDEKTLGPAIDAMFGKLPATSPSAKIADTGLSNPGKVYVYAQDIPQTMVEITVPAFGHQDKDYYALQVLNYIYGGAGFGSRLMEDAREKNGLTYGIYSSIQDYRHADLIGISTSTKNQSAAQILAIVRAQMEKLRTEKVSDKELADAKAYITGSMPLSLTSSEEIAAMVLGLQTNNYPADYLDHYTDRINAVTADDLLRVSKRVLDPAKMTTALVGKPENIEGAITIKELPNVQ